MTDPGDLDHRLAVSTAGAAMLLLQSAASQAEIGPFARCGRETPQLAARCYGAMRLSAGLVYGRRARP